MQCSAARSSSITARIAHYFGDRAKFVGLLRQFAASLVTDQSSEANVSKRMSEIKVPFVVHTSAS